MNYHLYLVKSCPTDLYHLTPRSENEIATMKKCPSCDQEFLPDFHYISKCQVCGLLHSDLLSNIGRGVDGLLSVRKENFERQLDVMMPLMKTDSHLLEIGVGDGWFLDCCHERNITCSGIEPYAKKDLLKRHPNIYQTSFPCKLSELGGKKFDAIVFNDALEHFDDIQAVLACCQELLKKDGLLVINIPNSNGTIYWLARKAAALGYVKPLDRLWQKEFPSPHIWYFNHQNLQKLIGQKPVIRKKMKTVTIKGLWNRIASTDISFLEILLHYCCVLILWTVSSLLPGDSMLHIYQMKR